MFTVTVHHHDKDWRNGDLEDKFELIESKNFKLKKDAQIWILTKLKGKDCEKSGDSWFYFTGVTWQHENTGEQMEEYYQYTLRKGKLN